VRVNVEGKAMTDPRFKALGNEIGATWFEAMGRCLAVWALAYERRTAVMLDRHIDAAAEMRGFARAMVAAELAGDVPGGVRLAGVTEGVQWLLIQDTKRAKALAAKRKAAGMVEDVPECSGGVPGDVPHDVPISLALDPDLLLSESPARAPARSISPTPEPVPQPHAEPPAPAIAAPIAQAPAARMGGDVAAIGSGSGGIRALPDEWRVLAREVWEGARKRYAELHAAGVDPSAKPPEYTWPGLETADVIARMRELLDRGIAVGVARVMCRAAIASAAKRAQDTRKLRYFTPPRFFEQRSFAISASETAEQATAPPVSQDGGLRIVGPQRAPGDDEPRFSAAELAATDFTKRLTPEERQARLATLVAGSKAP
jgi:hypothetical protein